MSSERGALSTFSASIALEDDDPEGKKLSADLDYELSSESETSVVLNLDDNSVDSYDMEQASMADVTRKSMEARMTLDPISKEEEVKEPFSNCMVEAGPFGLGVVDALHVAIIMEDLSDKLDVIGMSIDAPQVDLRTKNSMQYDYAVHRPVLSIPPTEDPYTTSLFSDKYLLRQHYTTVAQRRIQQMAEGKPKYRQRLGAILSAFGVSKFSLKGKLQAERTNVNIIMDNLVTELIQGTTFETLLETLEDEKAKYEGMREKIKKSVEDTERIVDSKKKLKKVRAEKKIALATMQSTMWGIEDATQEMLRRKDLEGIYTQNCGLMWKHRIKKICAKNEDVFFKARDDLRTMTWLYSTCHSSMMTTLNTKLNEAQSRLEYWMDKYETDKEHLQSLLDTMKMERARDLQRIAWLKTWLQNYKEIVDDDTRMKNIVAERKRAFLCRTKMVTRLQAWWRGEMVRKRLGPYDPKNQKKDRDKKKDKKDKKKKK